MAIQSNILKCRAHLVGRIVRPGQAGIEIFAVTETVQMRRSLILSQGRAWATLDYRRGHLWLDTLCVWLHTQWQVEQEGSIDILVQRVV